MTRSTLVEGRHNHAAERALQQRAGGSGVRRGLPGRRAGRAPRRPGRGGGAGPGLGRARARSSPRWTTGRSVPPTRPGRIGCCGWRAGPTPTPGATGSATRRPGGTAKALAELARAAPVAEQPPSRCCWRWANGCTSPARTGSAFSGASRSSTPTTSGPTLRWPVRCTARAGSGKGDSDSGSRLLPEGAGHPPESGRRPERPRPRPGRRGLAGRQRRRPRGPRGRLPSFRRALTHRPRLRPGLQQPRPVP